MSNAATPFLDGLCRPARSRNREAFPGPGVGAPAPALAGPTGRAAWGRAGLAAGATLLALGVQAGDEPPRAALDEARKASNELVVSVRSELMRAIDASGPLRAMVVCKYTVPELASAVSRRYGARVTRVSLTPRNPALGWADAWEQRVLLDFDERVARGEKAEALEHAEVTDEPAGRFMRYLRALPMQPVCLQCHGPAEQLPESIRAQLAHDYPHDRATGLQPGRVRGAVSFKKPL